MAEECNDPSQYPYHTAGGTKVDISIPDKNCMAHICHYIMINTANSIYLYDGTISKKKKKQYGLKARLKIFKNHGN
jgi:hypothetical protein